MAQQSEMLLGASDLSVGYGVLCLSTNITIGLKQGESLGITGKNGCGKSTLIRTLAGALPALSGTIRMLGYRLPQNVWKLSRRNRLAFLPQQERIFPALTVREHLVLAVHDIEAEKRTKRVDRILNEPIFSFLESKMNFRGTDLSGGESVLLALACIQLRDPVLVLLDEPSSGLYAENILYLEDLLHRWKTEGKALLLVEQNRSLVKSVCDEVMEITSAV